MPGEKEGILGRSQPVAAFSNKRVSRQFPSSARQCHRQSIGAGRASAKTLSYWGVGDLSYLVQDECNAQDIELVVFDEEHFREFVKEFVGDVHWVAQNVGAGTFTDVQMIKAIAQKVGAIKYYVKTYNGRSYLIFKGYAGLRQVLKGTRYRDIWGNKKLLSLALGKAGLGKNALMSGVWSVALLTTTNVMEFLVRDELTWADLGANVTVDLGVSAVATAAGALVATKLAAAGGVMFAVTPIGLGIVVSIGVGLILGKIADKTGLKKSISAFFKKMKKDLEEANRKANWWLHYINTPEGIWWLQGCLKWGC
ncbi:MAG: hypothetical protein NPIRA01_08280 [Nitrospirales bacterium]|nr:MAG: hypothetical protein NPIRA01_08280 [Nitrospirales bacterium]